MDTKLNQHLNSPEIRVEILEWVLTGSALLLLTVKEEYDNSTIAALFLLTIFFVERSIRGTLVTRRTGIELPVGLFVISAGSAAAISYQQGAALLQFSRILSSAAVFFLLLGSHKPLREIIAAALTLAAVSLAIYWPIQNDFSISPGKLTWINSLGTWLNTHLPAIHGPEIQSNVAAGTILVCIPFAVSIVIMSWKTKRIWLTCLSIAQVSILLFGLLMTSSRGAWMGLFGISTIIMLVILAKRIAHNITLQKYILPGMLLLLAVLAGFLFIKVGPILLFGQIADPTGSLQTRWELWLDGLNLVQDYFFTGSGLQSFWMVHAIYGLLIHVPYLAHIHNSFMQIWIEQGILGATAVSWGLIVLLSRVKDAIKRDDTSLLGWAGIIAISGAVVHGLVDVVFYVERTLPVVGFILGFASLLIEDTTRTPVGSRSRKPSTRTILGLTEGFLLLVVLFHRPIQAAWYANMGALNQTRTELTLYDPDHFDDPTIDQVRQSADLRKTEQSLQKALIAQPTNRTALHRLSMIALGRGNYDLALNLMEIAWHANFHEPRSRSLYSDALVAAGEPHKAAEIAAGLTWAESRLLSQAWARYWLNQDIPRASDAYLAVTLLNPNNMQARIGLKKTQQLLNK